MAATRMIQIAAFAGLIGVVALAAFGTAQATNQDWHVATLIETSNTSAGIPRVAADAAGSVTAAWTETVYDPVNGTYWNELYVNRFVPGSGWGNPFLLGNGGGAVFAHDAGDNLTMLWGDIGGSLWTCRYIPGVGWESPAPIPDARASEYALAVDSSGNTTVVWYDWSYPGHILANRLVPGQGWGNATLLETEGVGPYIHYPGVAADAQGNVIAVWERNEGIPPTRTSIWANRFTAGVGWGNATLLDPDGNFSNYPKLWIDATGNATVVFSEFGVTPHTLRVTRFTPGTGWGNVTLFQPPGSGGVEFHVCICMVDAAGNLTIIWAKDQGTLMASRFIPGLGWGTSVALHGNWSVTPWWVAVDARGGIVALWAESDGPPNMIEHLWAARFVAGIGWQSATLIETDTGDERSPNTFGWLAVDPGGNATVVWNRKHDGAMTYDIWANRYADPWNITVVSDPPGLDIVVDGVTHATPMYFDCFASSLVDGPPSQRIGSVGYALASWSDGGARLHAFICRRDQVVTAFFAPSEFQVNLSTVPPGLNLLADGVTVPGNSSLWWGASSSHALSAPVNQTIDGGRYQFSHWADSGSMDRNVTVNGPLDLVAYFSGVAFNIQILSNPPGQSVLVDGIRQMAPISMWVDAGTQLSLDAPSPQSGLPGVRYQFVQWSDGGSLNRTVEVNAPTLLIARFTTEYSISIATSPSDLSLIIDGVERTTPVGFWWAEGSSHTLQGTPYNQEVGLVRFALSSWRDVVASSRTLAVSGPEMLEALFAPADYFATIQTDPPAMELKIDGILVMAPVQRWWVAGSSHMVDAPSPQATGSARFVFASWSDNLGAEHYVKADSPLTLSAMFETQYSVTIDSSPAGMFLTIDGRAQLTPATFWWLNGSTHSLSAPALTVISPDTRAKWSSWSDAANRSRSIVVGGPLALRADFVFEFLLVATSPFTVPECDHADCWYANGTSAILSVKEFVSAGEGMRHAFGSWEGDLQDSNASATILMNGPKHVNATWNLQYQLSVDSAVGSTNGQGWYVVGSTAYLAVVRPNVTINGTTYTFGGWRGGVESDEQALEVTMDAPKWVTVNWIPAQQSENTFPAALAAASLLALVIAGVVGVVSSRAGFALDGFVTVPLFTRLRKIDVTSQYQRGRLIQFIDDNPGASYAEIRRRLQIANGGCAYHLRVLERNAEIRRVARGASVRFYPADYKVDPEALPPLSLVQRSILELVLARTESPAVEIGKALTGDGYSIGESTLLYHLKALAREKELISMRREGGRTLYFVTTAQATYLRGRLSEEAAADTMLDRAIGANHADGATGKGPGALNPTDDGPEGG